MIKENMSFFDEQEKTAAIRTFMTKVYGYMFGGLAVTALVSLLVSTSESLAESLLNMPVMLMIVFAELALVWTISSKISTLRKSTATFLFYLYSALNGVSLSIILMIYAHSQVYSAFFITAGGFAGLSLYALMTKRNLGAMSGFLTVGLVGLMIAIFVNIFFPIGMLTFLISVVGVIVFAGLTAYDTYRLKEYAVEMMSEGIAPDQRAVVGALMLYLDFINLFLFILRLLGRRD